jgi:hypothetical protein
MAAVDYIGDKNDARTNAEQSETPPDFRVSFVSAKERRFQAARRGDFPEVGTHLYFIQMRDERLSPVKIGRANNPKSRLAALQIGSPYPLVLLGTLENCGSSEFEWHAYLSANRMLGEWFSWSERVENTVNLALSGGDWRAEIAKEPAIDPDDWRIGSVLYEDDPRYAPNPSAS